MKRPPRHIERFDAIWRGTADRGVVAVADGEIVLHDAAEWRQRKKMSNHRRAVGEPDIENEPVAVDAKIKRVRTTLVADRPEGILLDQIVDRDGTLMLDVRA